MVVAGRLCGLALVLLTLGHIRADPGADMKALMDNLLKNATEQYDKDVLPPGDRPIRVHFGLSLWSSSGLNAQRLASNVLYRMKWVDKRLSWKPSDFGGLKDIRVNVDKLWVPDMTLYNAVKDSKKPSKSDYPAIVFSSGTVMWIPQTQIRTSCEVDYSHFPYDTQECKIKFGSWTYSAETITLDHFDVAKVETHDFVASSQWELTNTTAEITSTKYDCCEEMYPAITFIVTLRRNAAFFTYILVAPFAFLTLTLAAMFLLPGAHAERITMGVGHLVSMIILLVLLDKYLPDFAVGKTPLMLQYFLSSIFLLLFAMFISILLLNMFHRGPRKGRPSGCLVAMAKCFGRVVCVSVDVNNDDHSEEEASGSTQVKQTDDDDVRAWQQVGLVYDRVFFVIFQILTITTTVCLLPKHIF